MTEDTAYRFKHEFETVVMRNPGSESYQVTITSIHMANGPTRSGSRGAMVEVATRPNLSVLRFDPPAYPTGMTQQDYVDKAFEEVRARITTN